MKIAGKGTKKCLALLKEFEKTNQLKTNHIYKLINRIAEEMTVDVIYIKESWIDVNTLTDFYKATQLNA